MRLGHFRNSMSDESEFEDLSRRERAALDRTRTVAKLLDEAVRIPVLNYRVGLDPILGVLPISGDVAGTAFSLYIVAEAARIGVPPKTLLKMVGNIAIDTATGSIPALGTLIDAAWKSNKRNVSLLEDHLADRPDIE